MDDARTPIASVLPLCPEDWATIAAGEPLALLAHRDDILVGVNAFGPGEQFPNHLHEEVAETFIGIQGTVELWLDRTERIELNAAVVRSVSPGREHFLRNVTGEPALIVYIKAPNRPQDRVPAPWQPLEEETTS